MYEPCRPGHRVHRVAMATFWNTFHHEGKIKHHEGEGGTRPPRFNISTITYSTLQLRGQIYSYFSSTLFSSVGVPLPQYRLSLDIIHQWRRLHPALKTYESLFFAFYICDGGYSVKCTALTIGLFIVFVYFTAPMSHVYPNPSFHTLKHTQGQ